MNYTIRYNTKFRGHILVSCSNGHYIEDIRTGPQFGGSAAEARLSFGTHTCKDCDHAKEERA